MSLRDIRRDAQGGMAGFDSQVEADDRLPLHTIKREDLASARIADDDAGGATRRDVSLTLSSTEADALSP